MSATEIKVVMSLKDEISAGIKRMSQEMKVSIDSIRQYFSGITAAVAGVSGAIMGLKGVWDTLNLAAQAEQQEEAFRGLTASYGISASALISELKKASAETINTSNIMKEASIAIFQGISPDKLVQLMEGARAVARITGADIEDTFNRMAEAISSGQVRALKHLGIVVDLEKAYKDYADSINKAVGQLADEDKTTALLNATLEKTEELKKRINLEDKTQLERLQSLKTAWEDAIEEGQKALLWLVTKGVALTEVWANLQKLGDKEVTDTLKREGELRLKLHEKTIEQLDEMINKGKESPVDPKISEAQTKIMEDLTKRLNQITLDRKDYDLWALDEELRKWESVYGKSRAVEKMFGDLKDAIINKYFKEIAEASEKTLAEEKEAIITEIEFNKKLTDEIKRMTLDKTEYNLWMLDREMLGYIAKFGKNGQATEILKQWYELKEEEIKKSGQVVKTELDKSKKDVTAWAAFNAQVAADTVNAIREGFAGFFKDAFSGQLDSAKDLWDSFLDAMVNAYAEALAKMATEKLGFSSEGSGSGFGNLFSWIAGLFGGGTSYSSGSGVWFDPTQYFQHGGIVTSPTLAMVGETEPEVIAPVRALLNSRGGESNTTVIYVNAVDAASFADVVRRNPGAITSVVEGGIRNNSSIRHTIKRFS